MLSSLLTYGPTFTISHLTLREDGKEGYFLFLCVWHISVAYSVAKSISLYNASKKVGVALELDMTQISGFPKRIKA